MTPQRIKDAAETYAGLMVWVNTSNEPDKEPLFHEHISSTSYIAGATAEHGRAQGLVDALEEIDNSPTPANEREMLSWIETTRVLVTETLAKWKGEVEQPINWQEERVDNANCYDKDDEFDNQQKSK